MPSSKLVMIAGLCLALAAFAEDNEKKLKRADLPPAVEKTVAAQSEGATIKGFSQEKENGQIYYEAEMMVSGHSKDVTMSKDGSVVEVEEQVALRFASCCRERRPAKQGWEGKDREGRKPYQA